MRFRNYCNRLFRQSLITGFPIIASSSSCLRKMVKLVVFFICTTGFLYQTTDFLGMYFRYPTLVDIQVSIPETFEMPAITLCNKNRLQRKHVCTLDSQLCNMDFFNLTDFCYSYSRFCKIGGRTSVLGVVLYDKIADLNNTWEYVRVAGYTKKEMIKECTVAVPGKSSRPCRNYCSVPVVDHVGSTHICYSIESLWGKPDENPEILPLAGTVIIEMRMHPDEYLKDADLVQGSVYVHDARTLANPIRKGLTLDAGFEYNIYLTQMVKKRLAFPYQTKCTDYYALLKRNGGYGPITKKTCTEHCITEKLAASGSCIDISITYPHNRTVCKTIEGSEKNQMMLDLCAAKCNEACHESTFHIRSEIREDLSAECIIKGHPVCTKRSIKLHFIFNMMEVTTFQHEPKYESVEVFSYIGGYMGMWLGISLVALFDFLETMAYLLYYPCKRSLMGRKKVKKEWKKQPFYNGYGV